MTEFWNSIDWEILLRLLVAGVLGVIVGLEREYRAKEAGYRTHFLVCVGSALLMIVSKYGFEDVIGKYADNPNVRVDLARIAAQVVTGIGFIGAGTIILRKQVVRGLTTAAGIWAISGVGLAVGAGMYMVATVATILILIGLEFLGKLFRGLGVRSIAIELTAKNKEASDKIAEFLSNETYKIISYERSVAGSEILISVVLKIIKKEDERMFFASLQNINDVTLRKLE
ncbi:MAG: MgtC/SapB family protein [Candidatus Egerieousia sp.]